MNNANTQQYLLTKYMTVIFKVSINLSSCLPWQYRSMRKLKKIKKTATSCMEIYTSRTWQNLSYIQVSLRQLQVYIMNLIIF